MSNKKLFGESIKGAALLKDIGPIVHGTEKVYFQTTKVY